MFKTFTKINEMYMYLYIVQGLYQKFLQFKVFRYLVGGATLILCN